MHQVFNLKNSNNTTLFVDCRYIDHQSPNLIFCCTPVVSVTAFEMCYEPFVSYGFNVFALDFSGIGNSKGHPGLLSVAQIEEDLDSLVYEIKKINNAPIYLFGNTGTGGILAQNYAAQNKGIRAFAQYGVCIYGDMSPLGYPKWLVRFILPIIKLLSKMLPNLKVPFNPPAYNGYHAELDNGFYAKWLKKDPDFFKVNLSFLTTLLTIMLSKKNTNLDIPTIVFKTNHDRYYAKEYFDAYYASLTCEKSLIEIDDVHNSYYFYPERIAKDVAFWFHQFP